MEDSTFEILANEQKKNTAALSLITPPFYNIDDMDGRASMIDLGYSGCMCIRSTKFVDKNRCGVVYIDGVQTEEPILLPPTAMFGQLIGVRLRKYLHEYDRVYKVTYAGAYDTEGQPIPEFTFSVKTLARVQPGVEFPNHDKIVLDAAREGIVLLKNNNNTLPLGKGAMLNGFGSGFVVFRSGCLGAGKINPRYAIRVKEGVEKYTSLSINNELYDFYCDERDVVPPVDILKKAKTLSDTAVVFISRTSSEAHEMRLDKGGYYLTDGEREILSCVRANFNRVVLILNTAYPIECGFIEEMNIDAVLWVGLPGMAGGRALAEILEGRVCPSGKLPNTWAFDWSDYSSSANFFPKEKIVELYGDKKFAYSAIVYEEDVFVGYRYFDTFSKECAYMFGHGLSYTQFEVKFIGCSRRKNITRLKLSITNKGNHAGKEIVQIYAKVCADNMPCHRLVAFEKTKLIKPSSTQIITIAVPDERFSSYDEDLQAYVIKSGNVILCLGGTPADSVPIYSVHFGDDCIVKKVRNSLQPPIKVNALIKNASKQLGSSVVYDAEEAGGRLPYKIETQKTSIDVAPLKSSRHSIITFEELKSDLSLIDDFVAQMSVYELARLSVGGKTGWGVEDSGYAGSLFIFGELEKYRLPQYLFADGNNGLNMNKSNIGFPTSNLMCATWNKKLMRAEGKAIAIEAKSMGLNCILAPAMNIERNPLCGRHSEYFSEDPYLAGTMSGEQILGLESNGVATSIKHFFANNCELMRNTSNSIMTERAARDVYLAAFAYAFEVCVPSTVMTGYNAANGVYCSDNRALLTDILRGEMGFDGFVMTDWNGYGDEGIPALINAGVNFIAPGAPDDSLVVPIVKAVENGSLALRTLQESVKRLVSVIVKTA